jgi:hypothetical protein
MNRIRHLPNQRPIPPPIPLLEHHQPHTRLQRDRRPPLGQHQPSRLPELLAPTLHQRPQQLVIRQQRIQRRQILGQLPHLDRQHVVPQALRLLCQKCQHSLPFRRENRSPTGNPHRQTGRKSPLATPSVFPREVARLGRPGQDDRSARKQQPAAALRAVALQQRAPDLPDGSAAGIRSCAWVQAATTGLIPDVASRSAGAAGTRCERDGASSRFHIP